MNKKELAVLEAAFEAEIFSALNGGLLAQRTITLGGRMPVTGYELTHAGRFAYCASCE